MEIETCRCVETKVQDFDIPRFLLFIKSVRTHSKLIPVDSAYIPFKDEHHLTFVKPPFKPLTSDINVETLWLVISCWFVPIFRLYLVS